VFFFLCFLFGVLYFECMFLVYVCGFFICVFLFLFVDAGLVWVCVLRSRRAVIRAATVIRGPGDRGLRSAGLRAQFPRSRPRFGCNFHVLTEFWAYCGLDYGLLGVCNRNAGWPRNPVAGCVLCASGLWLPLPASWPSAAGRRLRSAHLRASAGGRRFADPIRSGSSARGSPVRRSRLALRRPHRLAGRGVDMRPSSARDVRWFLCDLASLCLVTMSWAVPWCVDSAADLLASRRSERAAEGCGSPRAGRPRASVRAPTFFAGLTLISSPCSSPAFRAFRARCCSRGRWRSVSSP